MNIDLFGLIIDSLIIGIIIFLALLVILFFIQGRKKQRNAPQLSLAIVFGLSGQFIVVFGSMISSYLLFNIGVFLVSMAFVFIYLHAEALSSLRPTEWIYTILVGLNAVLLAIILLLETSLLPNTFQVRLLVPIITSLVAVLGLGKGTYIFYKTYNLSRERATFLDLISIVMLFTYRCIFLIRDTILMTLPIVETIPFYFIAHIVGLILSFVGITLFLVNHIIHPDYIYRLPFPIHSIMFYNRAGITVYSQRFHTKQLTIEYPEALISGAFTAISALIQETLGLGTLIQHIDADTYHIFFSQLPDERGTIAVISGGATTFFQKSLDRFTNFLPEDLIDKINSSVPDPDKIKADFDSILIRSFPYLVIK